MFACQGLPIGLFRAGLHGQADDGMLTFDALRFKLSFSDIWASHSTGGGKERESKQYKEQ